MKGETEQRITNKRNKRKFIVPVIFCVCFVMMVSMVIPMALAYFTATSNQTGELSFAALTTSIIDNSGNTMTNGTFSSTFLSEKLLPGKEINFTNIKVKNTSNTNIYTLLKLTVTITKTGVATLTYSNWYTLNGEIVSTSNFSTNNHYATYLSSNSTANVNLTYTIPSEINNDYKSATAEFTLSAHSIQEYIPAVEEYLEKINYVTYLIIKKTDDIATSYVLNNNMFGYSKVNYVTIQNDQSNGYKNQVLLNQTWNDVDEIGFEWSTSVTGEKNLIIATSDQGELSSPYLYINTSNAYTMVSFNCDITSDSFVVNHFMNVNLSNISISSSKNISFGSWSDSVWSRTNNWKCFYLKNNDSYVAYLIPCVRLSDTKPGFYDKVNDVFYTNAGTGEFLYG